MADLESMFIKEFNRNFKARGVSKNIFDVPLPSEVESWTVSESDKLLIRGITEEAGGLYTQLNKNLVSKIPKGMVVARRKTDIVTRDFVRDTNGRFVYEDVKIPSGSIVVISKVNINLPYKYTTNEEGFGYVDYISVGKDREYMYIIPKKYLYKVNQTALALSVKNMKNYFGMGYKSWNSGTIFLHVIPYNPNTSYVGTKILKTSQKLDYSKEVKMIVDFWVANNVIPPIQLCETTERGNLVMKETSKSYDSYDPLEEFSLGEKEIYGSSENGSEEEGI